MTENVILVNENDEQIGLMEKLEAHQKGLLHRAFSVFVFNSKNELLIHQRALDKYHSPGLWTNTCCSHQRENESTLQAAHRRLQEEMGFDCELNEVFSFTYRAEFSNNLIEHEFDHVLVGTSNILPNPNPSEVAHYKWLSIDQIKSDIQQNPHQYTEWFKIALPKLEQHLSLLVS